MTVNVGVIGDSLAARWTTDGNSAAPAVDCTLWNGAAYAAPTAGNGQLSFGNDLAAAMSDTVQMINGGVGGTSLTLKGDSLGAGYWVDFATANEPYDDFKDQVIAAAADQGATQSTLLDLIVVSLGSNDTGGGLVSRQNMSDGFTDLFAQLRSDYGNVPIVLMALGRSTTGTDYPWNSVREGHRDVVDSTVLLTATNIDLALQDNVHPSDAAFITHGERGALAAAELLGVSTTYQGPTITSIANAATTTTLTITHTDGTDFVPTSGITGFTLSTDNWDTEVTISSVDRLSATEIQLSHANIGSSYRNVRYLYGANPDITGDVHDNTANALPLEWINQIPTAGAPIVAGDIKTAVARFTLDTRTVDTTIDLTISGLGWTPSAIWVECTNASADASSIANATLCIGAATGTSEQWSVSTSSQDDLPTTQCTRAGTDVRVVNVNRPQSASTTVASWAFGAFIPDGVQLIRKASTIAQNVQIVVKFFGGDSLNAEASIADLTGTHATPLTVTTGFETSLILTAGIAKTFPGNDAIFYNLTTGAVSSNGDQQSLSFNSADNTGAQLAAARIMPNGSADVVAGTSVAQYKQTFSTFTATSFDIDSDVDPVADSLGILALDLNDRQVFVGLVNAPTTAASDWVNTDVGFKSQIVGLTTTMLQASDTDNANGDSGPTGLTVFNETSSFSSTAFIEDGADPTVCKSRSDEGLYLTDDEGNVTFNMDSPTFTDTGFTFAAADITAADSTQRKFIGWAIEEITVAPSDSPTLTTPYPDLINLDADVVSVDLGDNISGETSIVVTWEPEIPSGLSETNGVVSGTVTTPTGTAFATVTGSNSSGSVTDSFQWTTLTTGDPSTGINVPINEA